MTQTDGYESYFSLGVDARVFRVFSTYLLAYFLKSEMCCIAQTLLGKTPFSTQDTPHDTSSTQVIGTNHYFFSCEAFLMTFGCP